MVFVLNWMQNLCETYDRNVEFAGKEIDGHVLVPVSHIMQSAQIECVLNSDAKMIYAFILEKNESMTLIPCTMDSMSRTSTPCAHPLFDKLNYIAKDFNERKSINCKKVSAYNLYIKELSDWCDSDYSNPYIQIIRTYLENENLIDDLVEQKILYVDNGGRLIDKSKKSADMKIFKMVAGGQEDVFIRFSISDDQGNHKPWQDIDMQTSFIDYYKSKIIEKDIDYITGEYVPVTTKNPSKIRNTADMAKLISSNDSTGFSYRGRFTEAQQAISIGYESSQKAHNTLRWLIERQGLRYGSGELAIVSWGTTSLDMINPMENEIDLFADCGMTPVEPETYLEYGQCLSKALKGYGLKRNISESDPLYIIGVDSATPGRLSLVYYQSLLYGDLRERISKWYESCCWHYLIYFEENDGKKMPHHYTGSPSPKDIMKVVYGDHVKDSLVKSSIKRILTCILDGRNIPVDFIHKMKARLRKAASLERNDLMYQGNIACAVIRKYRNDKETTEVWKMGLDLENYDRNYLYGRCLAYIDQIEVDAGYASKDKDTGSKTTNAMRYMEQFEKNPLKTLDLLFVRIQYYLKKLSPSSSIYYKSELNKLISLIEFKEEAYKTRPLNEAYLLGYFAQKAQFDIDRKNKKEEKENENTK